MTADQVNPAMPGGVVLRESPPAAPGCVPPVRPIRLCVIVTVDITLLNLCRGRFEYFVANGFEVTAVCGPTPHRAQIERRGVRLETAALTRRITPLRDLLALWQLYRILRRGRFDVVEVSTPKAALLGALAARLARVPCLVHLLRGLAYAGRRGWGGKLLRFAHWLPCRLADQVISVSADTREQADRDGVCRAERNRVLGLGSSNGVDLERFKPAEPEVRSAVRRELDIPPGAMAAGFCGRFTGDKGIVELVDAFLGLADSIPELHLLLIGDYDVSDRPPSRTVDAIREHQRIRHVGWSDEPATWMSAMDLFVLPTHREGFGTVLLEAAAMGLPVITTDAAGWWHALNRAADALRVPVNDVAALRTALGRLATDVEERRRLGEAGRAKVVRHFDCQAIWFMQAREFRRLVQRKHSAKDSAPRRSLISRERIL